MRRRASILAALALLIATRGAAQGSPNVPLDDPRLPLVEFLIQRGTIRDPSPMVRPFRRADVVAALERADTSAGRDAALVERLLSQLRDLDATARWEAEGRLGSQAFTRARRDLLHPAGVAAIRPYGDARLEGVFGPFVAVSRL
ncbi:MAG: hypothetical protein MUC69_10260, partial [Gemmatimonadales bacterium]|nr:hypothetical protein [Gemmatimonadales bacterium]